MGWRTWDEVEAEAETDGRLDEAQVAVERDRMRAELPADVPEPEEAAGDCCRGGGS